MRTGFWGSVCLLLGLGVGAAPGQGRQVAGREVGGRTRLSIPHAGGRWVVSVGRDETVAGDAEPSSVKVVGEIAGRPGAVVIVDRYSSRPGGMGRCQAGEESFVRVIGFARGRAVERFHEKLESCLEDVELASPGLRWDGAARTLEVDWISAPGRVGEAGQQTLRVGAGGRVVVAERR